MSRYVDVKGRCPACGARTLHVYPGAGTVHCLAPGCPDPRAAHKVLSGAPLGSTGTSAEQQARDLLERLEVDGAQNYSAGEIVELANLIAERNHLARQLEQLHATLITETKNLPVFVDDDPPRMVSHGFNEEVPARHLEFIPHTRQRTAWLGEACPDCIAEPGVHDRRHAEIIAATQEQNR